MTSTSPALTHPQILDWLSTRQYVHPHESLGSVLASLGVDVSAASCPDVAAINFSNLIGRFSRRELDEIATKLARAMAR
jgi:hypothetical protein